MAPQLCLRGEETVPSSLHGRRPPSGTRSLQQEGTLPRGLQVPLENPSKQLLSARAAGQETPWLSELHTKGAEQRDSTANATALDPAELPGVSAWGLGCPAAQNPEVWLADPGSSLYPLDENTG